MGTRIAPKGVEEEVLDEAITHMIEKHREVRALDEARLELSGGIYCVVEGCTSRRTYGYKVCSHHRHGRNGRHLYKEGGWHIWDYENERKY